MTGKEINILLHSHILLEKIIAQFFHYLSPDEAHALPWESLENTFFSLP